MQSLPPAFDVLLEKARLKHIPKDQILLYEGDEPDNAFILKSGIIKIYDINEQGNEKVLHILKAPGVIPFAFFSGGQEATQWFYAALTDCEVYAINEVKLRGAMIEDGAFANYLINWFSREVHEILVRLSSLGKSTVRSKLTSALKFLAVHHAVEQSNNWSRITFPVSHQLLANMVGVTRESTAVVMKELQDEGVIRRPRVAVLEIHFPKLLKTDSSQ